MLQTRGVNVRVEEMPGRCCLSYLSVCLSVCQGAAVESDYAAKKREAKKEQKYNQQLSQSGSRPSLIPLVFEHYGYWGSAAEDYLDCLSKKSKDEHGRNNEADFRDRWRRQISIDIQRCNAKVISKKLSKLSLNRVEDFLYDRDIQHHVH